MRYLLTVIAASVMLMANSCDKNKRNNDSKAVFAAEMQLEKIPEADTAVIPSNGPGLKNEDGKPSPAANTDWDKKIIKTGMLNIEVENYRKYNNDIHQLVKKWEAYIASEQENSSDYKIENIITIKIPVQYFDEAVQQISNNPGKLLDKQISAQDVTGEYYDTKARMEAKKRIRLRYLEMLQKARSMEEMLQVEREINQTQEQIEAGEGRVNYLTHSATFSTIQLTFFQVLNPSAGNKEEPGFGKRLLVAMTEGLKWCGDLVIFFVTLWPVWFVLALGIWILRRITAPRTAVKKVIN